MGAVVRRGNFLRWIGGATLALLGSSRPQAQEAARVKRIGFLRLGPPPAAWIGALRQGLQELGLVEGRHVAIEFALAPSEARVADAAVELVQRNVDVILASGTPSVLAAREATGTIPVVFVAAIDPVATGLVASLARPGGNVTGLTNTQADITGKQLQLLKELLSDLARIAIMFPADGASARYAIEAETAAQALGVPLQILTLREHKSLEALFAAARGASAVVMPDHAVFTAQRSRIAELALMSRLPVIYGGREFVNAGGLMSYGPSTTDLYRRAALYVDKILKGAKPADLPVEQPTRFELVISSKAANALGLTIPPALLARVDVLIE